MEELCPDTLHSVLFHCAPHAYRLSRRMSDRVLDVLEMEHGASLDAYLRSIRVDCRSQTTRRKWMLRYIDPTVGRTAPFGSLRCAKCGGPTMGILECECKPIKFVRRALLGPSIVVTCLAVCVACAKHAWFRSRD
jgi:hypothetical protein